MKCRKKNVSFYFLLKKKSVLAKVYFAPAYLDENNVIFVTTVTFREKKLINVSD